MRILILEDDLPKRRDISAAIVMAAPDAIIVEADNLVAYAKAIASTRYDLLVIDLLVPLSAGSEVKDAAESIVELTRLDDDCVNLKTPGIVITSFDSAAEQNFGQLNKRDFLVITFEPESNEWKEALTRKVQQSRPPTHFDFVILCALPKEAAAYTAAGYKTERSRVEGGIEIADIFIGQHHGVLVTCPRMGMVSCAITASVVIERFSPKLICMSGICGGVKKQAKIYDVIIAEACYQHDYGKWTKAGFEHEIYSLPIDHLLLQHLKAHMRSPDFLADVQSGIVCGKDELPDGAASLSFDVKPGVAATGSYVVASASEVSRIKVPQRKVAAIEMEGFALYEAAHTSTVCPKFFMAKSVVDDGVQKGDEFHRVGCMLSARVVAEFIRRHSFR